MPEPLDKAGLTNFVITVVDELGLIRDNTAAPGGGPAPPWSEIVDLLTRIATAVESIDAKTKDKKK